MGGRCVEPGECGFLVGQHAVECRHARRAQALIAFLDGPVQPLCQRLLLQRGQGQRRKAAGVGALRGFGVVEGGRRGAAVREQEVGFAAQVAAVGPQRAGLGVGGERLQRLLLGASHGAAQFEQGDAVFDLPGRLPSERVVDGFCAGDVAAVEPPEGFVDARFARVRLPGAPEGDDFALQRQVVRAARGQRERAQGVVVQRGERNLAGDRDGFGELAVGCCDSNGIGHHAPSFGVAERRGEPALQLLQCLRGTDAVRPTRDDQCVVLLRVIGCRWVRRGFDGRDGWIREGRG